MDDDPEPLDVVTSQNHENAVCKVENAEQSCCPAEVENETDDGRGKQEATSTQASPHEGVGKDLELPNGRLSEDYSGRPVTRDDAIVSSERLHSSQETDRFTSKCACGDWDDCCCCPEFMFGTECYERLHRPFSKRTTKFEFNKTRRCKTCDSKLCRSARLVQFSFPDSQIPARPVKSLSCMSKTSTGKFFKMHLKVPETPRKPGLIL